MTTMVPQENDNGEKGLRQKPSHLEVGAAGALRLERQLFPPPDEADLIQLVTLTTTKKDFLLWQGTLQRTANLPPSRYQAISHDQSLPDLSGDDWRQFIDDQGRTLNVLQTGANEALFGKQSSTPEGWFEFEEAKTEIKMVRGAAKSLAIGLYAAFGAIASEAPDLLESRPEKEAEAARIAKALLESMAMIVSQLQEQGVAIDPDDPDKVNILKRVAGYLSDSDLQKIIKVSALL